MSNMRAGLLFRLTGAPASAGGGGGGGGSGAPGGPGAGAGTGAPSRLSEPASEPPASEPPATPLAASSTTEGPPLASEDGAPPLASSDSGMTNEPAWEVPVPLGAGGSAGGPLTWENYKEFVVPFLGPRPLFGSDD